MSLKVCRETWTTTRRPLAAFKDADCPHLIHQVHVRAIYEAPPLRDGNGRELRRLHDVATPHLRALKPMDYEPSGPFITYILELKLDPTSMFEWQRHSQDSREVHHYTALLEFLDLRAHASENSISDTNQKCQAAAFPEKPTMKLSYHVIIGDTCVACKLSKHPLYTCRKFRSLPHGQMIAILKEHGCCINCLMPEHFVKQCPCGQKAHHTWLHIDKEV